MKPRSFWRDNGLSLVMFALFFLFLIGQTVAGWLNHNEENYLHREKAITLLEYTFSSDNAESVFENWESEFLQMAAYIYLTVCLVQRGSAESKDPDEPKKDEESYREGASSLLKKQGALKTLYSHSLSLTFAMLFILSFIGHAIGGAKAYSEELKQFGQPPVSTSEYLYSSRFWFESLQNWQSEFLAVGAIVVLSIWLREKGSPESKPLNAPHSQTGSS
jgi:hypothetical protein